MKTSQIDGRRLKVLAIFKFGLLNWKHMLLSNSLLMRELCLNCVIEIGGFKMDDINRDIGERLKGMRDILNLSVSDMAAVTGVSETEYLAIEDGQRDFSFTFLYKASKQMNIDLVELLTGESPHLSSYTLVRNGEGLPIKRRMGFKYLNLAYTFKDRLAEPFMVTAPYSGDGESCELALSTHAGQEMDLVISGQLRIRIGEHEEILNAGDSIYYDAGKPHGMVAVGGEPCQFLAVVMGERASHY
jgi:mannose-6-phosphate isomerase-like protein (cupin superfamily)/DNA-binding XRE family transcriptional regulator